LKLLVVLGIEDKAYVKPTNLSVGQQQRVAIARALVNNPAIILADEPTGNLDTKTGKEVFNLLKMFTNKYRRTILMVTHNPDLAKETILGISIVSIDGAEKVSSFSRGIPTSAKKFSNPAGIIVNSKRPVLFPMFL
jgi:ABC-type lipoprotein export system ATPase subunit